MAATGKDHARVNLDIWNDDDWLDLTPPAQHLYIVLWTSPALSYCGSGEWKPGKIAQRANGWTSAAVELAGAELARELFIVIDEDSEEFLLRSWIKHDGLWRTPNMAVSMANARADLASRTLRAVVVHEVLKVRREHPDSNSWKRLQVANLLTQKAVDPSTLPPYGASLTHGVKGSGQPIGLTHGVKGRGYQIPTLGVNPASNPAPTPAPAPTSCSTTEEGYVSTEGYEHDPHHPPPLKCPQHIDDPHPPSCGGCADARRVREAWNAEQQRRLVEARRAEQFAAADVRRQAISDCDICDDTGYIGTLLCKHDPEARARAERGSARVREALAKGKTA